MKIIYSRELHLLTIVDIYDCVRLQLMNILSAVTLCMALFNVPLCSYQVDVILPIDHMLRAVLEQNYIKSKSTVFKMNDLECLHMACLKAEIEIK
ncbi:hypothetical protein T4D_11058 [Trichinella pseudospiralis]|uniref:Uncharacterized protein n=1 Tax=Trichinella pseudospiralis TaxID=6337 RepID=A0A0V1G149_TRIPS|nr:hypothetical protein T4D_11058 [Trichinella pseudospiralis]